MRHMKEAEQTKVEQPAALIAKTVGLIVLGRGAERDRVVRWLKTAASVPGFIGFAVGRTSFWQPLVEVEAKRLSQKEAATRIAHNFETWIRLFEEARSA